MTVGEGGGWGVTRDCTRLYQPVTGVGGGGGGDTKLYQSVPVRGDRRLYQSVPVGDDGLTKLCQSVTGGGVTRSCIGQ